jgi:hypothetical protein
MKTTTSISVYLTPRDQYVFVTKNAHTTVRHHVSNKSLARIAVFCMRQTSAGRGQVVPYSNGWAWTHCEKAST